MKVCIWFTGLQRTINKTHENIESNFINDVDTFTKVYVTWKNENTYTFLSIYPDAIIYKVNEVTQEDEEFKKWKEGLQMHISWRRSYEPNFALFRYYQQIYLWKKAAEVLKSHENEFDLCIRIRTDINISGNIVSSYYNSIKENTIYFPSEPKHSIFSDETGCPDYYFIGKPSVVIKALCILDYLHKYRVTYTESNTKWFPGSVIEENIIQPESSMYIFLKGEGINIEYLNNRIEVIR
jgi:hypothetical protein